MLEEESRACPRDPQNDQRLERNSDHLGHKIAEHFVGTSEDEENVLQATRMDWSSYLVKITSLVDLKNAHRRSAVAIIDASYAWTYMNKYQV